ncbi:hypothetical protein [Flavobacterium foetidum]|uniref:hypothetical protein n=1 Tax=Flavobacterium foetidum TaxID=2026681 RepID=UPI00107581C3|nr:hypothetical protein [Flavobacterium foetidum]KAF2513432.1 hypothetical protein E0W73_14375 [Flavobacterium foetidum]
MKIIKHLNTFAITLPFAIIITYPVFKEAVFIYALFSTMLTGFIQVVIGIKMLIDEPKNRHLQNYISGVVLFFTFLFFNSQARSYETLSCILMATPPILAIYLSFIIYKKKNL